uniref:Secreted protein n=1 Tax=Opuntia streptacantha TaxID=393608 RepID=A0A7C8ZPF9_OPUST
MSLKFHVFIYLISWIPYQTACKTQTSQFLLHTMHAAAASVVSSTADSIFFSTIPASSKPQEAYFLLGRFFLPVIQNHRFFSCTANSIFFYIISHRKLFFSRTNSSCLDPS